MSDDTPADPPFAEPEPAPGRRRRRGLLPALVILAVLALLAGGGYLLAERTGLVGRVFAADYSGAGVEDVTVTIPPGASGTAIGAILVSEEVVASPEAWANASRSDARSASIQPGSYRLKTQLPAATALDMMLDPANRVRNLVAVPEGLRLSEQLTSIAAQTDLTDAQLTRALADPARLGLSPWADGNPEGYLFPDSYDYDASAGAEGLLAQLAARFTVVADEADVAAGAQRLGLTPAQVVVMASIIEKEVRLPADRPKVARVLLNRIAKGQPMQLDSTVHYAVDKPGGTPLTRADFQSDSPYNTYTHPGLPPGPISAPGRDALVAAANPADGDWLYFVTVNLQSGETRFTADYAEHERNVAEYEGWCTANGNPPGC